MRIDEFSALLVDDQPAFSNQLAVVFGEAAPDSSALPPEAQHRLKFVKRPEDAEVLLNHGWKPDFVFVDFHFTTSRRTGLATLAQLERLGSHATTVLFTSLDERGRTLFAAAAHRWFGNRLILDKSADVDTLVKLTRGADCTPPGWRARLSRDSHLVDGLFRDYCWLSLWRKWAETNGNYKELKGLPGVSSHTFRQFTDEAPLAAAAFSSAFGTQLVTSTAGRENLDNKSVITTFVRRNENFFYAPELPDILNTMKPWNHR